MSWADYKIFQSQANQIKEDEDVKQEVKSDTTD